MKPTPMKKVLAVSGIRSEYHLLYPVIDALRKDDRFEVKIAVCGAHLSPWHGFTLKEIEKDGFDIAEKIDYLLMTNSITKRAKGVGMLTYALSQTVEREKPNFLLVVGDREESIAGAIVGNYMNVLCAHIGGGDPVYGNADDPMRFAISKLAHLHFTTAAQYAKNLEKIGEEPFRIFNVGNPGLDTIKNTRTISRKDVSDYLSFDISQENYIVSITHPLSSEVGETRIQMETILRALETFCMKNNIKVIVIYPNTDPGSYDIIEAVEHIKARPFLGLYRSLPREIFVNVMRHAKALIGNSSMGILEAPFYKMPVVNVGRRQMGRLNAGNVEFVDFSQDAIVRALKKACFDEAYRARVAGLKNPYGDGAASEKIVKTLAALDITDSKYYVKKNLIT